MSETPLMQQYREIKARHQDAILFFRMGDFFEMFYEDAEVGSRVLGLTLTSRNNGAASAVPLAGVPAKAVGEYVKRLVRKGFRVAICEQVEDPKYAKGPVRREVIETVTPGAALADDLLDGARNNFLCALHGTGSGTGLAAVDVSTGEFRLATAPASDAAALLARYAPREILIARGAAVGVPIDGVLVTEREPWEFDTTSGGEALARRFGVQSLEGFGVQSSDAAAVAAAGALLEYLRELQPGGLPHLARPVIERPGGSVPLDEMTRRNLELVESLRGEAAGTLLDVLDRTSTPMGARLLRQWILAPLSDRGAINARLDRVEALANDALARAALRDALDGVRDIERLAGKVAASRATPRELRSLGDSLARLPDVSAAAARVGLAEPWDTCDDLATAITTGLVERPPIAIGDEPTIATGIDAGVDELRVLRDGGKDAIAEIQAAERQRTGIASLKVGYNRVFGYFIEVTNANKDAVPADYQRRQTLTGAERYVTPALKEYEERVLTAAERLEARERELFEALRSATGSGIARLQHVARRVAELDVVATFAEVAERERFVRPVVTDDLEIDIVGGRHPVVERMMPREQFIPNDVRLSTAERVIILTGPNMAGKSTILRQVGLIVLLAQAGSFVPAARATIGIVDRLFTRVGASDNLVRGQSTFMVEMAETSAILHTATARSLVLLDEIGRGTSTYDGVSIAWSVTEHLHTRVGCKTIFATHYHELTQLADELPALRNYNVAVREVGDRILFLHRMQPGGADRSYGIEVGRLAGLPDAVITRAREVLRRLESEQLVASRPIEQLALFAPEPHAAIKRLAALNPDDMTPLQALTLLAELKGLV
ncbi:MAG TPA: DNA mismatch repair protein MutS [Gemmatimonadaceae bacterium]|nr:DNA mismatch repair protein MutS [Gemmatimonadaceae bacterium]